MAPEQRLIADYERDVTAVMLAYATGVKTVFLAATEEQAQRVFTEARRRLALIDGGEVGS